MIFAPHRHIEAFPEKGCTVAKLDVEEPLYEEKLLWTRFFQLSIVRTGHFRDECESNAPAWLL